VNGTTPSIKTVQVKTGQALSKAFTDFATAESVRAQMPKLNRETLFGYRFPLPPIEVQERFSKLAEQIQSVIDQQSLANVRAEGAFRALLSRVFSEGEASLEAEPKEAAVA
jgi:type I restriction enzyme S subunit